MPSEWIREVLDMLLWTSLAQCLCERTVANAFIGTLDGLLFGPWSCIGRPFTLRVVSDTSNHLRSHPAQQRTPETLPTSAEIPLKPENRL